MSVRRVGIQGSEVVESRVCFRTPTFAVEGLAWGGDARGAGSDGSSDRDDDDGGDDEDADGGTWWWWWWWW